MISTTLPSLFTTVIRMCLHTMTHYNAGVPKRDLLDHFVNTNMCGDSDNSSLFSTCTSTPEAGFGGENSSSMITTSCDFKLTILSRGRSGACPGE